MTIRDIVIQYGFQVDRNSEQKAQSSIKGISSMAKKFLGAIGIAFSISGMARLAEAAADVNALKSQFSQVFGEMEDEAAQRLDAIANDTGVMVNRMKGSFTQIAAFAKTTGLDQAQSLEIADRAMQAVADSAAFYDRSIEDVTESMRSLLKGNYEQDASLGLSVTETTRNAAANKLYGKSFKDLTEAEKQFTLLSMVEDANKASGAVGQAARESGEWTNQLGNMKQSLKDFKAAVGQGILQPMIDGVTACSAVLQKATKAVEKLTDENGILVKGYDKLRTIVKQTADRFGGMENMLKILIMTVGAFILVMKWGAIVSGVKKLVGAVSGLSKMFTLANLKTLALVATLVILALIIEDFINFMQGNDSVIGVLFEKMGIDADDARETILNAFQKVKDFFGGIKDWMAGHEELVKNLLVLAGAVVALIAVFNVFSVVGSAIAAVFGVLSAAGSVLAGVIAFIVSPIGLIIAAIVALIAIGVLLYKNWDTIKEYALTTWNNIVSGVTSFAGKIKDGIVNGFQAAIDWITGLPDQALEWGADIINGIVDGITGAVGAVGDAVKGVADKITSFLHFSVPDEGPLTEYQSWMPDMMKGFAEGIAGSEDTVLDKIRSFAGDVAALMQTATATVSTAATSMVNNTSTSINQNVNISNSYSGGTPETQKNVSKAMKKSAVDATTYMARGLAYGRG